VGEANKYIADTEPFKLKGQDPATQERLATILHTLAQAVSDLNLMLSPFLPHAANDVDRAMGGRGAIAPMPEIREARELDPEVLPEAFDGRAGYPIITGVYATAPAWGRHDVVVGRAPAATPRPGRPSPELLIITDADKSASKVHCAVRVEDWDLAAEDLGSSNGTFLLRPGRAPRRLAPHSPEPLAVGDVISLSDAVTLTVEDADE